MPAKLMLTDAKPIAAADTALLQAQAYVIACKHIVDRCILNNSDATVEIYDQANAINVLVNDLNGAIQRTFGAVVENA
jgi:hypothetical protein